MTVAVPQSKWFCSGCRAFSTRQKELVTMGGCVLASACAIELHSALERAQSLVQKQQVTGLVDEVRVVNLSKWHHSIAVMMHLPEQARGPLTALRTLGSILVPRLRQVQGREVDRDVVQGMLTQASVSVSTRLLHCNAPCCYYDLECSVLLQGDRLQDLVQQLEAALHPAEKANELMRLNEHRLMQPASKNLNLPRTQVRQLKKLGNESQLMLPSHLQTHQDSHDT